MLLGCLLPLAFAPYFLWPLAILLPALLVWLLRRETSPRRTFLSGWLFGIGYFGFGVYWVYNSLHVFGQAPPVVAGGLTGLLVVYLALAPAITLWLWSKLRRRLGDRADWLLPLAWFALEWWKGWFGTGMPWLSLGYSQTGSPLAGFAPLIGVYGIGALCLLLAVALYHGLASRRYRLLGLPLLLPLVGWLLQQASWTEPAGEPLDVAMVQGNIPQEIKWRYEQRQNIFNTYWRETGGHWDSDLIVWPETALPGSSEDIELSVLQPMAEAAAAQNTAILTGLVVSEDDEARFYNSAVLLGTESGVYHKRHLVLFGEYYPMRWLLAAFSGLISIPHSDLTPGPDEQPPIEVRGNRLGISICFEDAFSRDILRDLPAANLLVNLSNDAWFGDSSAPHQHLQIAQMRSLETGRPMLRSTNTGVSAFIDHKGRIELQTAQFRTETIRLSVAGRSGSTPFVYFARLQGWLATAILLILLVSAWRRGGRA